MAVQKDKEAEETTKVGKSQELTNPDQTVGLEDGELPPSTSSQSSQETRKRKKGVFAKPVQKPKRAKRVCKKAKPPSVEPEEDKSAEKEKVGKREKILEKEEKDLKFDQMYAWFKDQQRIDRRSRRSGSDSPRRSHSRSRSRRSRSRSRESHSRSRYSRSKSKDSQHSRSVSMCSSRSSHSHRSSRRSEKSKSYSRSRSRSRNREHDISPDSRDENRKELLQDNSVPPQLDRADVDPLVQRINTAVKENAPKPLVGPALSEKLGSLMEVYVSKPEFSKIIKITEEYPRPQNVPSLVTPDLPQDMDKTIDNRVIKEDKRLPLFFTKYHHSISNVNPR